jgi:hypothetical protein
LNRYRFVDLEKNKHSKSFYRKIKLYKINPELLIIDNFDIDEINNSAQTMDAIEALEEKKIIITDLKNKNSRAIELCFKSIEVLESTSQKLKKNNESRLLLTICYILLGFIVGLGTFYLIKKTPFK